VAGTNGDGTAIAAHFKASGGDLNHGILIDCEDGASNFDFRIRSSADNGDHFTIQVGASGETTFETNDGGGAAAHLTCSVDGDIVLDPAGGDVIVDGNVSGSSTLSCVGAITTAGGINVQGSGIANAGNITGAGNVSGSGDFSCLNVDADDVVSAGGGFSIDSTTVITSQGGGQFTTVSGSSNLNIAGNASVEGNLGVTGSIRGKLLEVTRHYYEAGSSDVFKFINFANQGETNVGNATYLNSMTTPLPGRLARVVARLEDAQSGAVRISVHTGSSLAISNADVIEHVDVTYGGSGLTAGTFNFTGSQHFTAGSQVGVGVDPFTDPGRVSIVCIWEYDTTGVS